MSRVWSPQQEEIFAWFAARAGLDTVHKNLVVRARAGTGKTTTIVEGVSRAPETSILLAAFNKKIAEELTKKITNTSVEAKTLHSVGFGMVTKNWGRCTVEDKRGYRIAQAVAGFNAPDPVVAMVRKLAGLGKNMAPFATKEELVQIARLFEIEPENHEKLEGKNWTTEMIAQLALDAMELAAEKEPGATQATVDFDDMVWLPVRHQWKGGKYDLVVIDEAQDMNATQIMLARRVCAVDGRIAVVGDDRQAIYGFRGADSQSIDRLKTELKAVELPLTVTYRCASKIVAEARKLVADYQAAPGAVDGVIRSASKDDMLHQATEGDFILSRKNAPLAETCIALLKLGKRAKIEGRDIGEGIRALVRTLSKRAGSIPELLKSLTAWEEKEITRAQKDPKTVERKQEQIHDKAALLRVLCEGITGLRELDSRVEELFADTVNGERKARITCSSVHRSKGLETRRVFVLRDTLYPNGGKKKNSKRMKTDQAEEQNIEYVAITRAIEELVWVEN